MTGQDRMPASPEQLDVWLACQREPESDRYNIALDLEFHPFADVSAIRGALGDMLAAHEALRSSFAAESGQLIRFIDDDPALAFVVHSDERRYARDEARRWAAAVAAAPFDLTAAPLLRAALLVRRGGALLVLTVHHIVSDGWSTDILGRDFIAAYQARLAGGSYSGHKPVAPKQAGEPGAAAADERYWAALLRDVPAPLAPLQDLVPDGGGPGESAYTELVVPDDAVAKIRALARAERGSPAIVVLNAWSILLHAWSGQADGTFGVIFAGRLDAAAEHEINLRSRVLPMRIGLDLDRCFCAAVRASRTQLLDSLEHSEIPADRLRAVRRENADGPAVERTVFVHSTGSDTEWKIGETTVRLVEHEAASSKFDFALAVIEGRHGMRLRVDYDASRYRAATAELFVTELLELLVRAVADPASSCGELLASCDTAGKECAWCGPDQQEQVALVPDLVLRQAAERPDAIAIRHQDRKITYAELVGRASAVAHWFREHGVRTGDIVAFLLPANADTPLFWLAALLAGAAYLPLDPSYPDAQLQLALDDARPRVLVIDGDSRHRVQVAAGLLVTAEELMISASSGRTTPPAFERDGEATFNVLYTSGSTGRPKGVVLPHRGVARLMCQPGLIPLDQSDVVSQLSPLNFDGATYEIWAALCHGAELVVFDKHLVLSPRELRAALRAYGVTTLLVTTPLLNRIIEDAPDLLQSLRRVYFGGELISVPHMRRALKWSRHAALLHSYGPTENSFTSTCFQVDECEPGVRTLPIGTPVPGTQAHVVLERTMYHAPRGAPGELVLGGSGVAKGYLGDKELTAARFAADPFSPFPGARLYRTGDRVRRTQEGLIEFIGRDDNQVKIRSQRVELGEVETALATHPAVAAVFVTAYPNKRGEKEIAAYVALDRAANIDEIRRHARAMLPTFAVPRHIVTLPALPLTPTGKIDRRRLPVPDGTSGTPLTAASTAASAAAGTATGSTAGAATGIAAGTTAGRQVMAAAISVVEAVRAAWRTVVEHDAFGFDQNFFDAGGNSLLLVKLQEALRAATGVAPSIRDLLRYTTVQAQADLISGASGTGSAHGEAVMTPLGQRHRDRRAYHQPPATSRQPGDNRRRQIIAVSAVNASALATARLRLALHLRQSAEELRLEDVALTLDVGRERFSHRFAAVVSDIAGAERALRPAQSGRLAEGANADRIFFGQADIGRRPRLVFAFADWTQPSNAADGKLAYQLFDVVRHRVDTAASVLGVRVDPIPSRHATPLGSPTQAPTPESSWEAPWQRCRADAAAALRYALQLGIADQLLAWRAAPAAICGVGTGELAAATANGALAFHDGLRLAAEAAEAAEQAQAGQRDECHAIVTRACAAGPSIVVEIGPTCALTAQADAMPGVVAAVPTLAPDVCDDQDLLMTVAELWSLGVELSLTAAGRGQRVRLPGHPLSWDRHAMPPARRHASLHVAARRA